MTPPRWLCWPNSNIAFGPVFVFCIATIAAIPAGNCLNVSQHCPNDVDYLCDKTDISRRWCTCWGGVTECVTLGVCKFTPCKTCQVCLSWAALHTPQLFNSSNPGLVAAEVNTRCKGWGKTSTACQTAADAVALSEAGNSGKRGGLLCSLLNECVNPAGEDLSRHGSPWGLVACLQDLYLPPSTAARNPSAVLSSPMSWSFTVPTTFPVFTATQGLSRRVTLAMPQ